MTSSHFQEFLSESAREGMTLHIPDYNDPASVAKADRTEQWLLEKRQDLYGAYLMLAVAWDYDVLFKRRNSSTYTFDEVVRMLRVRKTKAQVRAAWERRVRAAFHDMCTLEDEGKKGTRAYRVADNAIFWTAPGIDQLP